MWIAGRWLVGGEGLPRLAASEPWLAALERDSDQSIARLEAPGTLWETLQRASGLNLLEGLDSADLKLETLKLTREGDRLRLIMAVSGLAPLD